MHISWDTRVGHVLLEQWKLQANLNCRFIAYWVNWFWINEHSCGTVHWGAELTRRLYYLPTCGLWLSPLVLLVVSGMWISLKSTLWLNCIAPRPSLLKSLPAVSVVSAIAHLQQVVTSYCPRVLWTVVDRSQWNGIQEIWINRFRFQGSFRSLATVCIVLSGCLVLSDTVAKVSCTVRANS